MLSKTPLHPDLREGLSQVMIWLDEMSIDERCDPFTGRAIAASVRQLIPAMTRRHGLGTAHLDNVLTTHEAIDDEPPAAPTDAADMYCGQDEDGSPMPLAKLITCASLRVTGQALMLKDSGLKMDFAAYVGISMALKAVALALTGRDNAGLNALWAWSGQDEFETPANWQTPLNRAELPLDLLGIDELDELDDPDESPDA